MNKRHLLVFLRILIKKFLLFLQMVIMLKFLIYLNQKKDILRFDLFLFFFDLEDLIIQVHFFYLNILVMYNNKINLMIILRKLELEQNLIYYIFEFQLEFQFQEY